MQSLDDLRLTASELLFRYFGLEVRSLGDRLVDGALKRRMAKLKQDQCDYRRTLDLDPAELALLHQELLVVESWFCRDMEPVVSALNHLRRDRSMLTVLSAPCARGEEAISVLDAALTSGFSAGDVKIDGYDASNEAIASAQNFSYPAYSFRSASKAFVDRIFDVYNYRPSLKENLRSIFSFTAANLLDTHWVPRSTAYDLILCRNLLIYLHPESQSRLLSRLCSYLKPDGLLIVSAVEAPLVSMPELKAVGSVSVVFTKGVASRSSTRAADQPSGTNVVRESDSKRPNVPNQPHPRPLYSSVQSITPPQHQPTSVGVTSIVNAADRGDLTAAYTMAIEYLESHPNHAKVSGMLGAISSALNQTDQARYWFERALALDPNDEELKHYVEVFSRERSW